MQTHLLLISNPITLIVKTRLIKVNVPVGLDVIASRTVFVVHVLIHFSLTVHRRAVRPVGVDFRL